MVRLRSRAPRERSAISEILTDERAAPETLVYADCILTRRKRHHMICDGVDSIMFRSRWWSDIMEWLEDRGITEYTVITDRDRYAVTVRRMNQQSER